MAVNSASSRSDHGAFARGWFALARSIALPPLAWLQPWTDPIPPPVFRFSHPARRHLRRQSRCRGSSGRPCCPQSASSYGLRQLASAPGDSWDSIGAAHSRCLQCSAVRMFFCLASSRLSVSTDLRVAGFWAMAVKSRAGVLVWKAALEYGRSSIRSVGPVGRGKPQTPSRLGRERGVRDFAFVLKDFLFVKLGKGIELVSPVPHLHQAAPAGL